MQKILVQLDTNPALTYDIDEFESCDSTCTHANDDRHLTFEQIADALEKQYVLKTS